MPSTQTGGTNKNRIYDGWHEITNIHSSCVISHPYALKTIDCFVIFLFNIRFTSNISYNTTLFKLPSNCIDGIANVRFPVAYYSNSSDSNGTVYLGIDTSGNVQLKSNITNGNTGGYIYLEGMSFNIVRKYYDNLQNY